MKTNLTISAILFFVMSFSLTLNAQSNLSVNNLTVYGDISQYYHGDADFYTQRLRLSQGKLSSMSGSLYLQTNNTTRMTLNTSGNVGIGSSPSSSRLKIYKSTNPSMEITSSYSNARLQLGVATSNGSFAVGSKKGDAVIRPLGGDHHGLVFNLPNTHNNGTSYIKFGDNANGLWFGILNDRTVRIDGLVYAKEIQVKTSVWADYVFADDYRLKPLTEVEAFIQANKHLPDVPSEKEVLKDGISVAKMNATLLQKVEELTLYVIDQQKQIEELKSEIKGLK